ncbi:MAG TPA: F0F1 ATP synthase subunit A, partial [Elusimicrobiota bacterium]|nr:F0F1 ATP synthase subunit A [Elusimicrobiota bacterium]
MNFEEVLGHHLLDHKIAPLFTVGGIHFSLTKHLLMMWGVGLFIILIAQMAQMNNRFGLLLRTALEAVILYLRDNVVTPILGEHGHHYLHYFLSLFFFVLFCNLGGVIPGLATATGNVAVTAGLALCTLGMIFFAGIKEQGVSYILHIVPGSLYELPWYIGIAIIPLIFVIEVMGLLVKCFALTIRLFANMIAGHIVALGFMSLIFVFGAVSQKVGLAVGVPVVALVVFVNTLELLVCVM